MGDSARIYTFKEQPRQGGGKAQPASPLDRAHIKVIAGKVYNKMSEVCHKISYAASLVTLPQ